MDCAVLFADVAGSTALYDVLGDERAFALVDRCLAEMSDCTGEFGGRVVKTIGDAVMSVFPGADPAAAAAAEMQGRVARLGPPAGVRVFLRIGFRLGPVVERDSDVYGDTVNLASRLCDLASRGQILTDRETSEHLSGVHQPSLRRLYSIPVKGKAQEVDLLELVWQEAATEMTAIVATPAPTTGRARLELTLDGARIEVGPDRRKVSIGRDHEADFTIRHPNVSRAHATIERRRERFVLTDHSSNGSYVTLDGRDELRVHHEELTLDGHGWIAFGQPRVQAEQVVEFRCLQHAPAPPGA